MGGEVWIGTHLTGVSADARDVGPEAPFRYVHVHVFRIVQYALVLFPFPLRRYVYALVIVQLYS